VCRLAPLRLSAKSWVEPDDVLRPAHNPSHSLAGPAVRLAGLGGDGADGEGTRDAFQGPALRTPRPDFGDDGLLGFVGNKRCAIFGEVGTVSPNYSYLPFFTTP